MGLWAGNCQEEGPWSYCRPTWDQTTEAEEVEPVVHWVYGVVAGVEGKRPEEMAGFDRSPDQVHMAVESLAESAARDTLAAAAAVAVIAGCRPMRPSRLEAVVGIHQDSGQAQHTSYQTIWKEFPSLGM